MENSRKVDGKGVGGPWLFYLTFILLHSFFNTSLQAQSVLRTGLWVKIGVTQSGIYRISQSQLATLNPAFASADPKKLRLYGNGELCYLSLTPVCGQSI